MVAWMDGRIVSVHSEVRSRLSVCSVLYQSTHSFICGQSALFFVIFQIYGNEGTGRSVSVAKVKGCLLSLDVTCSVSHVQSVGTVFCVLVIGSMHWYMLICLCICQPFPFVHLISYHFVNLLFSFSVKGYVSNQIYFAACCRSATLQIYWHC